MNIVFFILSLTVLGNFLVRIYRCKAVYGRNYIYDCFTQRKFWSEFLIIYMLAIIALITAIALKQLSWWWTVPVLYLGIGLLSFYDIEMRQAGRFIGGMTMRVRTVLPDYQIIFLWGWRIFYWAVVFRIGFLWHRRHNRRTIR